MQLAGRRPRSSEAIQVIRAQCGNTIKLVLDIGVQYQTFYLIEACRDLIHILVEPCRIYQDDINRNYRGINFSLLNIAASQEDCSVFLISCANNPSEPGKITHSYVSSTLPVQSSHIIETREIRALSIDTILAEQGCDDPDSCLVKIDVDGIEEQIMQGIRRSAGNIGILIIEASLESVSEKIRLARAIGFDLFDITDHGYYFNTLTQVELVFISRSLKSSHPMLDPWKATEGRLHPEHWQHV